MQGKRELHKLLELSGISSRDTFLRARLELIEAGFVVSQNGVDYVSFHPVHVLPEKDIHR